MGIFLLLLFGVYLLLAKAIDAGEFMNKSCSSCLARCLRAHYLFLLCVNAGVVHIFYYLCPTISLL